MQGIMIDLMKKTLLAGIGATIITKEKVSEALQDYIRQGKVSAGDARIMAERSRTGRGRNLRR